MSNQEQMYFVCAEYGWPTPGPVMLGNIISDPEDPEHALNSIAPPPFSILPSVRKPNVVLSAQSYESVPYRPDFHHPWMKLKSYLPGYEATETTHFNQYYICDAIDTKFAPTQEYLKRCMAEQSVVNYLKKNPKGPLYMVTALKNASNARGTRLMTERIQVTQEGSDKRFGRVFERGSSFSASESRQFIGAFQEAQNFVFGYKLHEIRLQASGEITLKEYTTGAFQVKQKEVAG
ncbi:hypothetical protein B0J13DRAFT_627510 [Dactylonectria estremocensis]|uniref:Uncharacterized protein n=1 Tax=Dactylonectria estremocensis TaxID=1079267 RepID=A0A9P9IMC4_9HYPO|nr:hypothetical protein B0J13DRAFT_627510 [Dactylonectria estremocensis]